jgi:hypothetical protein
MYGDGTDTKRKMLQYVQIWAKMYVGCQHVVKGQKISLSAGDKYSFQTWGGDNIFGKGRIWFQAKNKDADLLKGIYLVKQLKHLSCSSKLVMQTGLVPLCNVVQSKVGEKELEPVK